MKHRCDYCGGFEETIKKDTELTIDNYTCIKLIHPSFSALSEFDRDVCVKCAVKALDTVLGAPIKPKTSLF